MSRKIVFGILGAIILVSAAVGVTVWVHNPVPPAQPSELQSLLASAGYKPLKIPDPDLGPGSIIKKIASENGAMRIEWVGTVASCQVPSNVLSPTPGGGLEIHSTTSQAYDGKAALQVTGVNAGANIDRVARVVFKVQAGGSEKLDLVKLNSWLSNPDNKLDPYCEKLLTERDLYLVRDAFAIGTGEIQAYDAAGAKVDLDASKDIVRVNGDVSLSSSSTISFSSKVYAGLKEAVLLNKAFSALGGGNSAAPGDKLSFEGVQTVEIARKP